MGTMDLGEKKQESQESLGDVELEAAKENKRCCVDCRTTSTPLWRGGPAGPKSLCNACGIRYRKRMVSVMRLSSKGSERIKKERTQSHSTTSRTNDATTSTSNVVGQDKYSDGTFSMKFVELGKEVFSHKSPSVMKKQRCRRKRKLGEEEEAAVLLMSLSCGFIFA